MFFSVQLHRCPCRRFTRQSELIDVAYSCAAKVSLDNRGTGRVAYCVCAQLLIGNSQLQFDRHMMLFEVCVGFIMLRLDQVV